MRTDVPVRLIGGDQPLVVVSARFNRGAALDCALDTGASHAMLLPEHAARNGIKVRETREARGAAGPVRVEVGAADSIQVGELVAQDVPVLLTPELHRIGAAIGHRIAGNLGHSLLRQYRLTLDYQRLVLSLATSDEPIEATPARAALSFTLAHPSKPLIMLPVRVDDRRCSFALDTGASTTVVAPDLARRAGLAETAMPGMTGGGGAIAASAAVISALQIGGVRISRVRVAVAPFLEALSQATGACIDGIVGTNVLRRFRVTIDYPRSLLRLD